MIKNLRDSRTVLLKGLNHLYLNESILLNWEEIENDDFFMIGRDLIFENNIKTKSSNAFDFLTLFAIQCKMFVFCEPLR